MTPMEPRLSPEAFDALLEAASDRIEAETALLRERNRRLESLLAEKSEIAKRLQATWRMTLRRRRRIDAEIQRLLHPAP